MYDDVTPSRRGRGTTDSPHVVTAYVVEPGGPCNRYRWDADSGVPVLDGVLHPTNAHGVDLAHVPLLPTLRRASGETPRRCASWIEPLFDDAASELLAGLGPSLLAMVMAHPANPPGTQLAVRLLGAARVTPAAASTTSQANVAAELDDPSEWIAVPTADPTLTHVERVSDLPDDLRLRLSHALSDFAPMGSDSAQRPDTWLTADHVMAAYRAARARGRMAMRAAEDMERGHAGERLFSASSDEEGSEAFRRRLARNIPAPAPAQEPGSIWREIAPVSPAALRARGAAVYGEAN